MKRALIALLAGAAMFAASNRVVAADERGSTWASPKLAAAEAAAIDSRARVVERNEVIFAQRVRFAEVARLDATVTGTVLTWRFPRPVRLEAGALLFRVDLSDSHAVVFCGHDVFHIDDGHIGQVGHVCLADDDDDAQFDRLCFMGGGPPIGGPTFCSDEHISVSYAPLPSSALPYTTMGIVLLDVGPTRPRVVLVEIDDDARTVGLGYWTGEGASAHMPFIELIGARIRIVRTNRAHLSMVCRTVEGLRGDALVPLPRPAS